MRVLVRKRTWCVLDVLHSLGLGSVGKYVTNPEDAAPEALASFGTGCPIANDNDAKCVGDEDLDCGQKKGPRALGAFSP
jgi:hypothetical protein